MLSIKDAMAKAQANNWTIASSYGVFLSPVNADFAKAVGWDTSNADMADAIQLSLKSVDIPQHSADLVEKILAGEWHFTRNDDEMYTITFTFRDMNGGSLYRIFKNVWSGSKINYPDDYAFTAQVYLISPKFGTLGKEYESTHTIFFAEKIYITSLSQLQLSHETNEILEFSVEFKTNEPAFDGSDVGINLEGKVGSLDDLSSASITGLMQTGINKGMSYVKDFTQNTITNWATGLGVDAKHSWDS